MCRGFEEQTYKQEQMGQRGNVQKRYLGEQRRRNSYLLVLLSGMHALGLASVHVHIHPRKVRELFCFECPSHKDSCRFVPLSRFEGKVLEHTFVKGKKFPIKAFGVTRTTRRIRPNEGSINPPQSRPPRCQIAKQHPPPSLPQWQARLQAFWIDDLHWGNTERV